MFDKGGELLGIHGSILFNPDRPRSGGDRATYCGDRNDSKPQKQPANWFRFFHAEISFARPEVPTFVNLIRKTWHWGRRKFFCLFWGGNVEKRKETGTFGAILTVFAAVSRFLAGYLVNDNYKDALATITLRHELVDVHGLI
jgi:hypothetical protein